MSHYYVTNIVYNILITLGYLRCDRADVLSGKMPIDRNPLGRRLFNFSAGDIAEYGINDIYLLGMNAGLSLETHIAILTTTSGFLYFLGENTEARPDFLTFFIVNHLIKHGQC